MTHTKFSFTKDLNKLIARLGSFFGGATLTATCAKDRRLIQNLQLNNIARVYRSSADKNMFTVYLTLDGIEFAQHVLKCSPESPRKNVAY